MDEPRRPRHKLPTGFEVIGISGNAPFAAIADERAQILRLQFHPEVMHTPNGAALLRNFVRKISGATGDWTMRAFKDEAIDRIRAQVGKGRVICGLSGGVNSAVAAGKNQCQPGLDPARGTMIS